MNIITEKQLHRRASVYISGLFILAVGVAFAINSDLGVSPVNSFPYILSRILNVNIGICVFAFFAVLVLFQIIILRSQFKWINLAQIAAAFIFGYFVDLARLMLGDFSIPTYFGQLAMLGISIILIATGIIFFIEAKLVSLPPEGFVLAITEKKPVWSFHKVKMVVDSVFVVIAILFSFLFLDSIYGVREGTVLSAVLIGKAIPFIKKATGSLLKRFIGNI